MDIRSINNYFGDMDLFLMDLILKGQIPERGKVLDVGCGEGRNALYFIQNEYEYHGWDTDASKLKLLEYISSKIENINASFEVKNLKDANPTNSFDFIICSRMLHFAQNKQDFLVMWNKLSNLLAKNGVIYVSMDSMVDTEIGHYHENGLMEFPDGKFRFALTKELYEEIKKGFKEIEPLKTLVQHEKRAQSFLVLKKA